MPRKKAKSEMGDIARSAADDLEAELEGLADSANKHHVSGEGLYGKAMVHFRGAGSALREAKAKVPHGEWQKWVEHHCLFDIRTAQVYMQIDEQWDKLSEEPQSIAHFLRLMSVMSQQEKPQEPVPADEHDEDSEPIPAQKSEPTQPKGALKFVLQEDGTYQPRIGLAEDRRETLDAIEAVLVRLVVNYSIHIDLGTVDPSRLSHMPPEGWWERVREKRTRELHKLGARLRANIRKEDPKVAEALFGPELVEATSA
jgi:Protein of unknown function (DUF3102)